MDFFSKFLTPLFKVQKAVSRRHQQFAAVCKERFGIEAFQIHIGNHGRLTDRMPGGRRIAHTPHSKNLKCSKSIFRRVVLVRRQTALSGQWKSRYPKSGSVARLHFHVLFGNRAAFSSVCMGTDGRKSPRMLRRR